MAELDSRIAMGVQPLDVAGALGRGFQLRDLAAQADARRTDTQLRQQEMQAKQQAQAAATRKQGTLAGLHQQYTQGGKLDRSGFSQGLAESGLGTESGDYQKQWSDADKAEAEHLTKNSDRMMKTLDYSAKALGGLLSNPNATADDVVRTVSQMVSAGLLDQQQGAQIAREVPGDPRALRQYLQTKATQALQAKDMLAAALPQLQAINLGGHTQMVDTNALTNPTAAGQTLQRSATQGELEAGRHNRASEGLTARGQDMTDSRARERLAQDGAQGAGGAVVGRPPKPLPAAALKMVREGTDAIGTASSINADLGAIEQQIDGGKLSFGPVSNLISGARNAVGASNEESRNFATFKANMEKLRNDSLRLNKGVQTDGDAQRAWNELFQSINDTKVVRQRLQEIKRINERATQLRRLDVDGVLQNYGHAPMDTSGYTSQPSAIAGGGAPAGQSAAEPAAQASPVLDQARAAVKAGADRAKVAERLRSMGVDPAGL